MVSITGSAQIPTWEWSHGWTTNAAELFRAVAVDNADGSVYVVGDAENSGNTLDAFSMYAQDQGVLMKFSRQGSLLWYVPIGGAEIETATTVALAPDGTAYVAGLFSGTSSFYHAGAPAPGASLTATGGSKDAYLAAYSPDGQLLFVRQFGNNSDEGTPVIAADDDGITMAFTYTGTIGTANGQSSAGTLNGSGRNILLVRLDTNGAVIWTRSGGSSVSDELSAVVSDGARIYVGYIGGQTPVRWYSGAGTQLGTSSATRNDHHITAFDMNGNWGWTRAFTDPSSNIEGPMRLALGCGRVYAAGAVDGGTVIGDVTATGGTGNDYFFVARLVPTDGQVEWVRIGSTAATGNNFHPYAMAVGTYGTVHIGGSFAGSVQFQGHTVTAGSGTDIFLLSIDANGQTVHFGGIPSNGDQQLYGMAADHRGGLAIVGTFRAEMALPGAALTGPSGNANAFVAWGQIGPRLPEFGMPSRFEPLGSMSCMSNGPHDLNTWAVPVTTGHATTVIASTAAVNTGEALGLANGGGSVLAGNGASLTLGLSHTLPASEYADITWRMPSSTTESALTVAFSADNATWTTVPGNIRSARNTWVTTRVPAPVDARYVRLTCPLGSAPAEVDAVNFAFGTMPGGTWSGTGVNGTTLDLTGVTGPVDITHTHGNGPCASYTTVQVQPDNTPPTITCPNDTTVFATAMDCTVVPEHGEVIVTDDCNTSAPLQIPQYTYLGTFAGHTYFRSWAAADWNTAKAAAESFPNGQLVTLNTAAEENWINEVLLAQIGSLAPFWIGLNDAAHEGHFVWASGEPLFHTNWRTGQPDNYGDADHVYMNMGGAPGWDDAHVSAQFNWIIEFDALPRIQAVQVSGPPSGTTLTPGVETITYSATDHAGNTSTCSFQIAVIDTVRPVIACPEDIHVTADPGACGATVHFTTTATDNCTAAPVITWSHGSGTTFPVGSTIVTVTATDASANASSCSFMVHVDAAPSPQLDYGMSSACALSDPLPPVVATPPGGAFHADGLNAVQLGPVNGILSPTLIAPGTYTIAYIVQGDCPDTAFHVITLDGATTWYADQDNDGHGDPATTTLACTQPAGYVPSAGDDCPMDPLKQAPGQCGCGIPDTDTDGDSIADCNDPCDNTTDGQPCDDGDAFTANDTWMNCTCLGEPDSDGDGVPDDQDPCDNSSDGQPCDDGDPTTINDVLMDCICVGTAAPLDCAGVPNGTALPGTPCDDGDPMTVNDTWGNDCTCSGTLLECESEAGPDQAVCGSSTTLQAVGDGMWTGSPGLQFSDPTSPVSAVHVDAVGSYEAWWTVTNGPCVAVDTVHITFNPVIDAAFHYAQDAYCRSDMPPAPWVASAGGGFTGSAGLWIDAVSGAIDPAASQPGTYTVTHAFAGPCPASDSVEVTIVAPPDASWEPPSTLCADGNPITLNDLITGTPGGTWAGQGVSNASFHPTGLSGTIAITYTVSDGPCMVVQEGMIMVDPGPTSNAGPDATVCGYMHVLSAGPADVAGTWSVPAGITISSHVAGNATVIAGAPGMYTLTWTTDNGTCTASDAVTITFHDPHDDLFVDAGIDRTIEVLSSTELSGSASPGASLLWSVLQGPAVISTPTDSITEVRGLGVGANIFLLTATMGICGHASDTVTIVMKDLFVPQGFSPNGDGVNDTFEVTGMSAFPGSRFEVFNRWGQLVYASDSYTNEWDGRSSNGETLPDDTYFHVLNLTDGTTYNGYIVIKR